MLEMNCVFCSFVENDTPHHDRIWESDTHIAFLDHNPVTDGHTLVIPKYHKENVLDLDADEYRELMDASRTVALVLKERLAPKVVVFTLEGLSVPHVHMHLIPQPEHDDFLKFTHDESAKGRISTTAEKLRTA
jgi:histidine triad (HIT) family protein